MFIEPKFLRYSALTSAALRWTRPRAGTSQTMSSVYTATALSIVSGVSLWKCTSTAARLLAMISSRVRSAADVTDTSRGRGWRRHGLRRGYSIYVITAMLYDRQTMSRLSALCRGPAHLRGIPGRTPLLLITACEQRRARDRGANCGCGCPPHRIAVR